MKCRAGANEPWEGKAEAATKMIMTIMMIMMMIMMMMEIVMIMMALAMMIELEMEVTMMTGKNNSWYQLFDKICYFLAP